MPASKSTTATEKRPPLWKVWFVAARPHTLTASIAPNIVAYHAGVAKMDLDSTATGSYLGWTLEWTLFCMLMQLGTNLHNDYADFVKGADNDKRVGQARATQKGWLTPFQTAAASGLTVLLGLVLGMRFVAELANATDGDRSLVAAMVLIVVSSIFNAFAYTGGPWPLGYIGLENFSTGYSGLGDLCVFLYFGVVATLVPPVLYAVCNNTNTNDSPSTDTVWLFLPYAIQVAVLSTNIIVVNNLRDRHTDVLANKRTLAVRFGAGFCYKEYLGNQAAAYGLVLWNAYASGSGIAGLLPLLSYPLAYKEWRAVLEKEGSALNPHVGGAAKVQLLFCILLAVSLRIGN